MNKEIKFTIKQLLKITDIPVTDAIELKLLHKKDPEALEYFYKYVMLPDQDDIEDNEAIRLKNLQDIFSYFEDHGYIKVTNSDDPIHNYEVRGKLRQVFGNGEIDVSSWIEEWRNIFPKGGGTYRYRGDKQGCIKKMKTFMEKNPKVTKDEIFRATRVYVKKFFPSYAYMKQAHYFIDKDGTSSLLSEIEGLTEKSDKIYSFTEKL